MPELAGRNHRAGVRHLMSSPGVRDVATLASVRALVRDRVPFRATFFDKSPAANWLVPWHQDTALPLRLRTADPSWGPWSMKDGILHARAPAAALARIRAVRLHLDESSARNGPLRVLPGSHLLGVLSDDAVAEYARRAEAVDCLVPRGGALVMSPLLIHASAKISQPLPRRVLHLEFAESLEMDDGLELAIA